MKTGTTVPDLRQAGEKTHLQGDTQTPSEKGACSSGNTQWRAEQSVEARESTPKGVIVKLRKMRRCSRKNEKEDIPGTGRSPLEAPAGEERGPVTEPLLLAHVAREGARSRQGMDN